MVHLIDVDSLLLVPVQVVVQNFDNVEGLLLGDPVPEDSDYLGVPDSFFIIYSVKKNLYVVYYVLLKNGLVDLAVHRDEALEIYLGLLLEYFIEGLGANGYFVHVEDDLETFLEFLEGVFGVSEEGVEY